MAMEPREEAEIVAQISLLSSWVKRLHVNTNPTVGEVSEEMRKHIELLRRVLDR